MRLILIRHAKASWGDLTHDDHARPLSKRGTASATAIGGWLRDHGYLPDRILCSDAQRTQDTTSGIIAALGTQPAVTLRHDLYLSGPDRMLDALSGHTTGTVAMVAHNPGMAILADMLLLTAPRHAAFGDYPTGATTIIDFDAAPTPRQGTCVDFTVPRDLMP